MKKYPHEVKLNAELEVIERPGLSQDKQIYPACIEKMFASRAIALRQ
jgi:hypothetical protein